MTRSRLIGLCLLATLPFVTGSCGDSADRDGDGEVTRSERAAEMSNDAFIPMKAGLWETKFTFDEIEVPTLGKAKKQQIMEQVAKGASSTSCVSEEQAKNPGADFFGGKGSEKCVYRKFDISGQNAHMMLSCAMEGMGGVDMDMAGVMGEDQFNFDTKVAMRLPLVGKIKLKGEAVGKLVGACTAP